MSDFVGTGDKFFSGQRNRNCPECGSNDTTTVRFDGKKNSRCWGCGHKWSDPIHERKKV